MKNTNRIKEILVAIGVVLLVVIFFINQLVKESLPGELTIERIFAWDNIGSLLMFTVIFLVGLGVYKYFTKK